jgi:aspartyl-tRNA(Asn)/glutamyl-tRNA(Gln) amidotransferase subunit B
MSKNFQITQYEIPLSSSGFLVINGKKIRIRRIHMEEDPAKIIHVGGIGSSYTLIDYNRSGIPLIEIVTEPDFESPQEARLYLQKLSMVLEYLKVYDSFSEASMKTDANISLEGHERIELKNITGTKEIERALNYEIIRQRNILKRGGGIIQETRAWNSEIGISQLMRTKETEEDYGYITETDLTKQEISSSLKNKLKNELPELPDEKKSRFIKQYNLSEKLAESLVFDIDLADLFERISKKVKVGISASWIAGPLMKTLNYNDLRWRNIGIKEEWLVSLLKKFEKGEYTDLVTEQILRKIISDKKSPDEIIRKYKFRKMEKKDISYIIKKVLENNKKAVDDYKKGEEKAIHFLVGQILRESKGSISAEAAKKGIIKSIK